MARKSRSAAADCTVRIFLAKRFERSPKLLSYFGQLWDHHVEYDLFDDNMVKDFTSGDDAKLWQRTWEMLLGRHLNAQGYKPQSRAGCPDFRVQRGERSIWIEATAPEPKGIPPEWLSMSSSAGSVPHDAILLRWTTAFDAKLKKLASYRNRGIIGDNDAYVIAINSCQLSLLPYEHGPARLPIPAEVVFGAPTLGFIIDGETGRLKGSDVRQRFVVQKSGGKSVDAFFFLDETNFGISALIGCSKWYWTEDALPFYVVHNPFAKVKLPRGFFGPSAEEWIAVPTGGNDEEFELGKAELSGC